MPRHKIEGVHTRNWGCPEKNVLWGHRTLHQELVNSPLGKVNTTVMGENLANGGSPLLADCRKRTGLTGRERETAGADWKGEDKAFIDNYRECCRRT